MTGDIQAAAGRRNIRWGVAFMAGFAAWWASSAAAAAGFSGPWTTAAYAVALLLTGAAILRSRGAPQTTRPGTGRKFLLVVLLEVVAIFAAASLLPQAHRADLVLPAVALIVGLHFLPLAGLFRAPAYKPTAAAMCLAAAASLAVRDPATRELWLCTAMAAILFLTCLALLIRPGRP
jgi:hypothetical protein